MCHDNGSDYEAMMQEEFGKGFDSASREVSNVETLMSLRGRTCSSPEAISYNIMGLLRREEHPPRNDGTYKVTVTIMLLLLVLYLDLLFNKLPF